MELNHTHCMKCFRRSVKVYDISMYEIIYECNDCDWLGYENLSEKPTLPMYHCPIQYCSDNTPKLYSELELQLHLVDDHHVVSVVRNFTKLYVKFLEQVNTIGTFDLVDDDVSNTSEMGKR